MVAPIVGICRFSFLGRGDWRAFSGIPRGSAAEAAAIERSRAALYGDARLRFRFHSFERLTLASLRAQTDPDFHFLVLSSPALPRLWQERLRALCQTLPQARLVLSDAADVGTALAPVLAELARPAGPAIQFRLDDDDCLCGDYVARLVRAARIMQDQRGFAFSLPRALVVTHYQGGGPGHYECSLPFHAAGAAARLSQPHRSVFAFGHYALMRRFPAMLDHGAIGSLQLKFQGHDSRMVAAVPGSGLSPLDEPGFRELLARDFPFLDPSCLSGLMALRDSAG